ncbi:hypothetical protein GO013_08560 [Pseudodesulfovibrio sp. JC047]|uniref:FAD:protein FMN transferase n=1 Tax=Pseudodesulfovibrio sp. JC047 TaxID=2683199 RepID=UPI0013D23210|nr:FAD:protein FMN transferase [Pseudodesulfovibrio sp. JC047]NDV19467.1 hypothetical protein [Pseudodesulfovibrio sp. JC047]
MSMVSRRKFLRSFGMAGVAGVVGTVTRPVVASADDRLEGRTETQLRMGTFLSIEARHIHQDVLDEALDAAFQTARDAESVFTRHTSDSPLGILNAQGVLHGAPASLVAIIKDAFQLARKTDNGFNPTITPVLDALATHAVPTVAALPSHVQRDLAVLTDPKAVVITNDSIRCRHSGMGVTLDGVAKGHIVDQVALTLERHGVADYLVNGGGDIRMGSSRRQDRPWRVGIEDASGPGKNLVTCSLHSGAMATSGNYESRATKGYDHLVASSPSQGPECHAVTVQAPTCAEADSLATALFAMGVRRGTHFLQENPAYACLWQTSNGMIASSGWRA